ncbi:unnamed protein product, partial [Effrenium voratum]
FAFKGKGKGKGKRSPQLNVDPAKKLWIGNIPEDAKWKDLQALVDKAGKSRWVEIFRGKGKGTGAVVYSTAEEAQAAKASLNGADLCGSSIVVDSWERGRGPEAPFFFFCCLCFLCFFWCLCFFSGSGSIVWCWFLSLNIETTAGMS